jgi:integrase
MASGSVAKDGAGWYFVVDLPRGPDGRRRQRKRRGFPRKRAAEEAMRRTLGLLDRGQDPFGDQVEFGTYMVGWMNHHSAFVAPSTMRRYRQLVELHLVPALGSMRLARVTPAHVQRTLDEIDRAPRTVQQARAVLSRAMKQAVEWGLIPSSPVAVSRAPRAENPELDVPDSSTTRELIAASVGTQWELPVLLAAVTGARRGEVLAIRWSDVDIARRRAQIARSLSWTSDGFNFKEPKTRRSRREVALPAFAADRLAKSRIDQARRKLLLGPAWHDADLVCERGDGHPINPDQFSKAFKRLATLHGHPAMRLHDLRHAAATTMMEQGVHPTVVSRSLGHASESFTMQVYGHVRDEMLDAAAEAIGSAYGGDRY